MVPLEGKQGEAALARRRSPRPAACPRCHAPGNRSRHTGCSTSAPSCAEHGQGRDRQRGCRPPDAATRTAVMPASSVPRSQSATAASPPGLAAGPAMPRPVPCGGCAPTPGHPLGSPGSQRHRRLPACPHRLPAPRASFLSRAIRSSPSWAAAAAPPLPRVAGPLRKSRLARRQACRPAGRRSTYAAHPPSAAPDPARLPGSGSPRASR